MHQLIISVLIIIDLTVTGIPQDSQEQSEVLVSVVFPLCHAQVTPSPSTNHLGVCEQETVLV